MQLKTLIKASRHPIMTLGSEDFIYWANGTAHRHLWLVAAPKSGSTWLSRILKNLLKDWQHGRLFSHHGFNEQELQVSKLLQFSRGRNRFSPQQHCRFSERTMEVVRRANLTPILQVRNIMDAVVSFLDHYDHEGFQGMPMAYMDDANWIDLTQSQRIEFIITMVVPWYFNFYAGWLSSPLHQAGKLPVCRYEDLVKDPQKEVRRLCNHCQLDFSPRQITNAIEMTNRQFTRKNRGVPGRGFQRLNPSQKQTIVAMSRFYPHIDFSIIGIPSTDSPRPPVLPRASSTPS